MLLVPMLTRYCGLDDRRAFATSVAVILPLCGLSAAIYWMRAAWMWDWPCPIWQGGFAGGFLGGQLSGGWMSCG